MEIQCTGPNSISHFFSEANYRFQAAWRSWTRALTVLCLQESSYLLLLISRPSLRGRAGLVQQLLPYMTQGFSPPACAAEGIPLRTTTTWARLHPKQGGPFLKHPATFACVALLSLAVLCLVALNQKCSTKPPQVVEVLLALKIC